MQNNEPLLEELLEIQSRINSLVSKLQKPKEYLFADVKTNIHILNNGIIKGASKVLGIMTIEYLSDNTQLEKYMNLIDKIMDNKGLDSYGLDFVPIGDSKYEITVFTKEKRDYSKIINKIVKALKDANLNISTDNSEKFEDLEIKEEPTEENKVSLEYISPIDSNMRVLSALVYKHSEGFPKINPIGITKVQELKDINSEVNDFLVQYNNETIVFNAEGNAKVDKNEFCLGRDLKGVYVNETDIIPFDVKGIIIINNKVIIENNDTYIVFPRETHSRDVRGIIFPMYDEIDDVDIPRSINTELYDLVFYK